MNRLDHIQELEELIESKLASDPHFYDDPTAPPPAKASILSGIDVASYTNSIERSSKALKELSKVIVPSGYVVTDIAQSPRCPGCYHFEQSHWGGLCRTCGKYCDWIVAQTQFTQMQPSSIYGTFTSTAYFTASYGKKKKGR